MTEDRVCPICRNPRRSSSHGSLTQWIVACNCDLRDLETTEVESSIIICRDCGKRIGEGRAGSFTQFIFRSDVCRCQVPKPLRDSIEAAEAQEQEIYVVEEMEEAELEVDRSSFPTERYKPLARLGSGTGGAVYLARDTVLNKKVAVKILQMLEAKQLVGFQEEARATSKLNHPSIVGLIDFGLTGKGIPYMVLEYFPGLSLEIILERDGPLDWQTAQMIFEQVCDGLAYAHDNGIYHRDIKPSNLLLQRDDTGKVDVRIIDFGVAKVQGHNTLSGEEQGKTVVGAPLYMSPDAGLGIPYDSRSEIYSLGCVIFESLTGKTPFLGETAYQTLALHAREAPPLLVQARPQGNFPRGLEQLVAKALAKKPDERFQDMHQFKKAIAEVEPVSLQQATATFVDTVDKKKTSYVIPLRIAATALAIGVALLAIAKITILAPAAKPTPAEVEKIEKEEKEKEQFQQTRKELSELKTDEILRELNLTGGKWEKGRRGLLQGHEITDEDFKTIGDISDTTHLKITVESKVTGEGFQYLKEKPFTHITIMTHLFDDRGMAELIKFKKLRRFAFHYDNKVTRNGYRMLAEKCPELDRISLRFMNLPPGAIQALSGARILKYLDLGHSEPITISDLEAIGRITTIRGLTLTDTGLTDEGLKQVLQLPLVYIDINDNPVTDEGLLMIARQVPTLKQIKVTIGRSITSLGAKRFIKLRPDCKLVPGDGVTPLDVINLPAKFNVSKPQI